MNAVREALDKDFFKAKLIELGYYKTPEGKQLYELDIDSLKELYEIERAKVSQK